ncbi:proline-rich basic protein 1 [Indicator indicator]|uniref:proline-rich basic protein 1 n=1 Tax=Indicator indicator TaxID=1002788 RepID=UPI0023DEBCA2|nr:proline-rich basic protein 1 [Indicator indicator]
MAVGAEGLGSRQPGTSPGPRAQLQKRKRSRRSPETLPAAHPGRGAGAARRGWSIWSRLQGRGQRRPRPLAPRVRTWRGSCCQPRLVQPGRRGPGVTAPKQPLPAALPVLGPGPCAGSCGVRHRRESHRQRVPRRRMDTGRAAVLSSLPRSLRFGEQWCGVRGQSWQPPGRPLKPGVAVTSLQCSWHRLPRAGARCGPCDRGAAPSRRWVQPPPRRRQRQKVDPAAPAECPQHRGGTPNTGWYLPGVIMPRGKRDPVLLSQAELPVTDGEGPRSGVEGRRSTSEEEGHLPGLPRDDLTKSMSGSSVSSYHSALCSEGTETFKDCLEFLDEEAPVPRDTGQRVAGAPSVPPPPVPLSRPQQAQLSVAAKNSPALGQGGRMGPLGGDRQLATAATTASRELPLPRQPGGMLGGAPSDSDEADGEVRALTARAFRSLSGLPGAHLDMCSSHTSSSLSNSLSEDGGRPRRWPVDSGEARGTVLLGLLGKEQFECVDVELESGEARKGHCKKRTVPKRQILLKRKERKETSFGPRGDISVPQPLPPTRKEPLSKGRAVGEDFKLNYKQFMKTASLDTNADKTRAASSLVKNVLAKKMQYEQMIKMEQKGLRGSSTSSGPSSAGTDLLGDGLEGKSSSLSRSDCSFSAEDLRGSGMLTATVDTVTMGDTTTTTHPAKGVVLSEAMRENVCKLKKTFNELNERMKYQEVLEGHRLPDADEEHESERTRYRRARALFEAHSGVGKALDVAPRFERVPKPWPSLRERAIWPSHPQPRRCEPNSRALPALPSRHLFTSRAQEVKLLPQSQQEEKPPVVSQQLPGPGSPSRGSPPAIPPKPKGKGKVCIPQPRDVRKLVKNSYSLCFGTASTSRGTSCGTMAPASSGEPPPAAPLVIHCTSVRRQEPVTEPGNEGGLAATSHQPAPACAEGPTKLTSSQPSPTQGSPVHITRVQATRRRVAAAEGPPTSPPHRERSELRVPPRAPAAEGVPHVETHLHVLVGRRSPVSTSFGTSAVPIPEGARDGSPAQSSAVLRTEKTVLLPPSPSSPTEGKKGHGHGGTRALQGAEELESAVQQHGSSDHRDPHAGPPAGDIVHPQPVNPAARRAPEPPTREQRQKQPVSQPVSAGCGGFAGGPGAAAPFRTGEGGEGPSGQLPEQREAWEHLPKWPLVTEPQLPPAPADTSNYLAIPVKAPRSSPMPKLPLVPSPASASSGTSAVPNTASTSFGTPLVPSLASTSFGTSVVPNTASMSSGTPLIPNPASVSFGTPLVPNPSNLPFGTPFVPNPTSMSFGTPVAPNPTSVSFGISAVPNEPTSTSFGTPMVPNMTNSPFVYPSASSLASTSFGTSLASNPTNKSFGTPLIPYLSSASFGTPLAPNPSSASFGTPLFPNPSSASFGTPLVPNPSSTSFGTPLVPNPSSAPFGSPLITNPIPTSLRHPSVPSLASTSFGTSVVPNPASMSSGTPFVPNPSSVPLGTDLHPLPSGEAPWSKPGPEPPLPQPHEGLVAAEQPVLLPSAQPQPRLEDPHHFLRRTDGASPSSKTMPSPTKAFAPQPSPHRRMLVDPDSGKCYYMEPPRQPQLKTLYDPETGQYLEVLIPPAASHTGLYQAPFNPLVLAPGVYGPPHVPYSSFPGLMASQPPSAPSPVRPDQSPAENPSFSGTFSSAPKGEGPPTTGGPDCGYLESLYYIPTGMRASPGPSHPPAHTNPPEPEKGPMPRM